MKILLSSFFISIHTFFSSFFVQVPVVVPQPVVTSKISNISKALPAVPASIEEKTSTTDSKTFTIIDDDFAKDKNGVYISSDFSRKDLTPIKNSDSETFKVLNRFYAKDKNQIYFHIGTSGVKILEEGDPLTLRIINPETPSIFGEGIYVMDKNNVYTEGLKISGVDLKTFTPIFQEEGAYVIFSKDKNHIYFKEKIIADVDSVSFSIINSGGSKGCTSYPFIKDKNGIYLLVYTETHEPKAFFKKIKDVDSKSFELLDCGRSKDKNHVYGADGEILPRLDSKEQGRILIEP